MTRPLPNLSRWGRRSTLLGTTSPRIGCTPPSLRQAPEGNAWQRLLFWLMAPAPENAAPPPNRLPAVREAFLAALQGIATEDADQLRWRIQSARSLRELWHARADLFRIVAINRNQSTAERQLSDLNRHFPARAPRSQFGAL
jgi:hypothetical protein